MPRLPQRQASMEMDDFYEDPSDDGYSQEASPKMPRRRLSMDDATDFEEWLAEGPQQEEKEELPHIPVGIPPHSPCNNRKSVPCIKSLQELQAGGKCPRLPQRSRSMTHGDNFNNTLRGPPVRAS